MIDLIAEFPLAGLDETRGACRVQSVDPGPVWSVAAFPGEDADLPGPGQIRTVAGGGRLFRAGRQMAFLIGADPEPRQAGAITDQSDAWAWVRLSGAGAGDVLARLCPLDLRDSAFAPGSSARGLIGHMTALILKTDAQVYEIAVFRSMGETLRHELLDAMESVAARC